MNRASNIGTVFFYFSVFLLGVSVFAMLSFFELGGAIDVILKENMHSVVAGEEMVEKLSKLHVFMMKNRYRAFADASSETQKYLDDFNSSLIQARNNITIKGEGEIIERISGLYRKYTGELDFLKDRTLSAAARDSHFGQFIETSSELNSEIHNLLLMNHRAIISADENARKLAKNRSIWMVFFALVGFVSAFYLNNFLKRRFTDPISEMMLMLRRVRYGMTDVRLKAREGMLGEMTEIINSLLDVIKSQQNENREYAVKQRNMLASVLDTFTEPLFIIDSVNEVQFTNYTAHALLTHDEGNELLHSLVNARKEERKTFEYGGRTWKISRTSLDCERFTGMGELILLK